jgi:agmatinase
MPVKTQTRKSAAAKTSAKKAPATKASAPKAAAKSKAPAKKVEPKKAPATTQSPKTQSPKAPPPKTAPAAKVEAVHATGKALHYFGVPSQYASPDSSQVHIIPCPYEETTSYGKGAKNGPKAILEASQHVELFDDELWTESFKIGIHTQKQIDIAKVTGETERPFDELYKVVRPLVEFNKFPVVIGGEHSITLGAVRACADRYPDLSILQIGAHADCRKSHGGNPYTHATTSYHLYKRALKKPRITQVGVRNISSEEVHWMEKEKPNINIYWARHQDRWNFQEIISTLSDTVYLTIDVNALDSALMPSTGTPEPGGMSWYQLVELIKILCIKKNVVAADIVELAPIPGMHAPDFLCAKLLYKIIGYRFALDLGVTKKYL